MGTSTEEHYCEVGPQGSVVILLMVKGYCHLTMLYWESHSMIVLYIRIMGFLLPCSIMQKFPTNSVAVVRHNQLCSTSFCEIAIQLNFLMPVVVPAQLCIRL